MSTQYVGELRMAGFNFAPAGGWLPCDGSIQSISQYEELFNLIGTSYGGDGVTTFALPDLRGRVAVHQGSLAGTSYIVGQTGGVENVTITSGSFPAHTHPLLGSTDTASPTANPSGAALAPVLTYTTQPIGVAMANSMIGAAPGSGQPHENLQPFQAVNWIIATAGVYPTQS